MLAQFDSTVLEAVSRASKRLSALVCEEMKTGIYDLATIACIAPWIGVFGTIVGIVNSFSGCGGQRSTCIGPVFASLSQSMWFAASGLLVGLVAFWSYEYLASELRSFDQEMENASLELLNQLGRFSGRFAVGATTAVPAIGPMLGELRQEHMQREEKLFHRCLFVAGMAVTLQWFVQAARSCTNYFVWFPAPLYACVFVPITVAICCLFLYPFWSKFLNRRPGVLVASGSVLALCWSVAEFLLGTTLP